MCYYTPPQFFTHRIDLIECTHKYTYYELLLQLTIHSVCRHPPPDPPISRPLAFTSQRKSRLPAAASASTPRHHTHTSSPRPPYSPRFPPPHYIRTHSPPPIPPLPATHSTPQARTRRRPTPIQRGNSPAATQTAPHTHSKPKTNMPDRTAEAPEQNLREGNLPTQRESQRRPRGNAPKTRGRTPYSLTGTVFAGVDYGRRREGNISEDEK